MATNTYNIMLRWLCGQLARPAAIPVLIVLFGLIWVLTLHPGMGWGGDSSHYIHHARNLVEGRHYLDTNYVLSSVGYFIGPYYYPPVYPLLLTPVYWLFGLDYEPMKWLGILCFSLGLYYAVRVFSYRLGHWQLMAVVLLLGLNPYLWKFSNLVSSDFTFLMFSYLSLYLMFRAFGVPESRDSARGRTLRYGILLGLVTWLAYATREIGVVLPLTLLTCDIVCRRRISLLSVTALLVFAGLAWMQGMLLSDDFTPRHLQDNLAALTGSDSGPVSINHFTYIRLDPGDIKLRIITYRWALQGFWAQGDHVVTRALYVVLTNLTMLGAFAGYCLALFRRITVLEIFLAGYVAALLAFSAPGNTRYLVPLFPLVLYYLVFAYRVVLAQRGRLVRLPVVVTYLAVTGLLYGIDVAGTSYREMDLGLQHPQAEEMFDYIREHTAPEDTIVFRKPRIMALLTRRASAGLPAEHEFAIPDLLDRYLDALEADYLVVMNLGEWMLPVTERDPPGKRLFEVFSNDYFIVYQVRR